MFMTTAGEFAHRRGEVASPKVQRLHPPEACVGPYGAVRCDDWVVAIPQDFRECICCSAD